MKRSYFLFVLCFVSVFSVKLRGQNYDSLFAERERILLAGVDYHRGLIKWNALNIFASHLDVAGEKKMNLNFSWTGRMLYDFDPDHGGIYGYVGVRYYYNLEERIIRSWTRRGQKTSCFSADYFEADYCLGWNYGPWDTGGEDQDPLPPGVITGPTLKIGTQRRLWKYYFWDASLGYNVVINHKGRLTAWFGIGLEIQ